MGKNRSLLVRLGKRMRPVFNKIIARGSRVPNTALLDKSLFPWTRTLEDAAPTIIEEFLSVLKERDAVPPLREISPDHKRIAPDHRWKSFFLYGYGIRVPDNCAKAPLTAQAVSGIPGLCSALFSVLEPGGRIPPHNGVTKGMLNCHLGLSIPKDSAKCWIEIGGRKQHWAEGRLFIFDDTYTHCVENDTDELRGILFIQFERPVSGIGRIAQKIFLMGVRYSAFVKDTKAGIERWNARRQGRGA